MNTAQKGFASIVLIILVIVIVAVGGYFVFVKKSQPVTQTPVSVQNQQASLPVPDAPTLTFTQGAKPFVQINFGYSIAKLFNIYRSTSSTGGWQKIISNFPSNAHTAVDYDYPKDITVLYYRITSVGEQGKESFPSPTASVVVTTKVTDKGNLYSVEIPKDWTITENIGARGVSLSSVAVESPDWKGRSDTSAEGPCSPVYYEAGAFLTIGAQRGEQEPTHYGEGGGPETGIISKKNVVVDGISGVYHVFKEPCTYEGQLLDAHFNYKGNNYVFRLAYNPSKYPQGETVFTNILNSIKFVNNTTQTNTSFKVLSPKAGDSWKIGETYTVKFQNLPKGSFVSGWLQDKSGESTGSASIGVIETGRDGNPSSNIQIKVPSQWCGGGCGAVEYVTPGQYRLLLRISPSAQNPSDQTFYSDWFMLTN